ncbi:pilus assembly protein [Endozoicomonas sp.]|uniref:pilus assembly protein n=1 Tax=Endozoicomonas sp. TaxID=1892382 RepID=UPI00383BEF45
MRSGLISILLVLVAGIRLAGAEDIELYVNPAGNAPPNVLIIYDTSTSMCESLSTGSFADCQGNDTRDTITRNAIIEFIRRLDNVNISAMSFNQSISGPSGGRVRFASRSINTARTDVITEFQTHIIAESGTSTPLDQTLYEAFLYLSGQPPEFGFDSAWPGQQSVAVSMSGGNYLSPITEQCQASNIVYFSDGESNSASAIIDQTLIGNLFSGVSVATPSESSFDPNNCAADSCLDELAWYMHNNDINGAVPGVQTANIHMVAGFINTPSGLLDKTAEHGGGEYFNVADSDALTSAFNDIADDLDRHFTTTLTAPATSLDAFNSVQHSEEVYYPLFEPGIGPRWRGNLKRYRQGNDNQVYDAAGNLAIDSSTGFFSSTAKSFWSSAADGDTVSEGGMAEQLSRNRPVFTNATSDSGVSLDDLGNKLHETNGNITAAMLGAVDTTETQTILQWARGVDVDDEDRDSDTTDDRTSIGDPLHTQPQVITYFRDDSGGTAVVDRTVYFTTNDGFLHAVDTADGSTEFSFIPRNLLGNQKTYRDNAAPDGRTKIYGLDGPMTTWIYDKNGDGDLLQADNGAADTGEHAYLYLTMRRGGNNIYSVDVINRASPVLRWVISGDADNDSSTDSSWQFSRLGQTWSTVTPTTVMWNGNEQAVLLFGGGYDPAIDGHTTIQDSNVGNAVFMVDAERGSLLWTASSAGADLNISDMKYSIPAELSLVDIDGDGATDYFFAADTGGQVFRFDIKETNTGASTFADGGRIANLAGTSDGDARRFFEAPTVAVSGAYDAINIAIGSGFRPSPLSTLVNDRMYVIRDEHVTQAPTSYNYASNSVITESDLYDATDNLIQDGTSAQQTASQTALDSANGWYLRLGGTGEKILSQPTAYDGVLLFTTFTPVAGSSSGSSCTPPGGGNSYLYAVNIENAGSVINFDTSDSNLDIDDRRQLLMHTSIAPRPSIMNPGGQGAEICVGTECFQDALRSVGSVPLIRRLWRENR